MEKGKYFIKSILAGIVIGMGGLCYLCVENRYLGAFLFSIGLISVLAFNFNLYTGWVCKLDKYENPIKLFGVLFFNGIGATIIGLLSKADSDISKIANEVIINKFEKPLLEWIVMGIFCGIFIGLAVWGWIKLEGFNKSLIVILCVMGFILTGSEHVVADIFYISASKYSEIWEIILRIILAGFSNLLGGLLVGLAIEIWAENENRSL